MVTTPSSTVTSSALANMQGTSGGNQSSMMPTTSGGSGGNQPSVSSATTINLGGPTGLTAAQQQALLSTDLTQLIQLLNSTDQSQLANVDFNKLAMLFNMNTVSILNLGPNKRFSSPLLIIYFCKFLFLKYSLNKKVFVVDRRFYSFAYKNFHSAA